MEKYPSSPEIEKTVIAELLWDKNALTDNIYELTEQDFYNTTNEILFKTIRELTNEDKPVELLSVFEKLEHNKRYDKENKQHKTLLDLIGGKETLLPYFSYVSSAALIKYHISILKDKALKRDFISKAQACIAQCEEDKVAANDIVSSFVGHTFKLSLDIKKKENQLVGDSIWETVQHLESLNAGIIESEGLKTGFSELDYVLGGIHPGQLIVIAGKTGHGKTAFTVDVARNVAKQKKVVSLYSLEMSLSEMRKRILQSEAGISLRKAWKHELDGDDWKKIVNAVEKIKSHNIYVNDKGGITIDEIYSRALKLQQEKGLDLIIVDTLQLTAAKTRSNASREQEVSAVSRGLKSMAMNLQVPVIAVSQFSRNVESRDGLPRLSDLRESGQIEQDANAVLFIYNCHTDKINDYGFTTEENKKTRELYIAKNRDGESGNTILLRWNAEITSFSERTRVITNE